MEMIKKQRSVWVPVQSSSRKAKALTVPWVMFRITLFKYKYILKVTPGDYQFKWNKNSNIREFEGILYAYTHTYTHTYYFDHYLNV